MRSQSRGHSRSRSRTRHSRSRSRSRTPSPVSKSRDRADRSDDPDYDEPVVFLDTETRGAKTAPPTRLVEVTDETAAFLKQACSKRLESSDRLSTRNAYALPKVPATKTAVLDAYIKPEVSQNGKATDKELGVIQTAILDSMAPLTAIVEADAKCDNVTHKQAVNAAKAAIQLVGNANAKFNHLRRTKIISQMNKALLPLTEDDENFIGAAPFLFGREFAQKSKELVDQVRAMRSHLPGNKDSSSKPRFFFVPNSRGGTSTAKGQGGKATKDSDVPHKGRDPSGTNEHIDTYCCSKLFDNRFQKYTAESPSMSGYKPPQTSKLSPSRETKFITNKIG